MSCNCNNNGLISCGCEDNCPNRTSEFLFDGTFSSIPVPAGSTLNDVLQLLEEYSMTMASSVNLTYTISSLNCLGLAPGVYGYTQVLSAIITKLCETPSQFHFKFIKEYSTIGDGDHISIPYTEITSCTGIPAACLGTGVTADLPIVDYHIQVWRLDTETYAPATKWVLAKSTISGDINYYVDPTTGDLEVAFDFSAFVTPQLHRIVIIA